MCYQRRVATYPAQATAVSWILKDGMQHAGKLICSSMGAKMDSEPKSWRILADVLYDRGTALEVISPLCPQLFLEVAGLGNFAKGDHLNTFQCHGDRSWAAGNGLASTLCSTTQRKTGKVSSPAELRYREDLLFPNRLIEEARSVKIGQPLRRVLSPQRVEQLRATFPKEKFLLGQNSNKTYMVLEHTATGEDALRGCLVAAFASEMERSGVGSRDTVLNEAHEKMVCVFPMFVSEVRKGWYTDQFLDGNGSRIAYAKSL